jgi:flagellar basal-body rod protein FlgC
MNGLTEFDVLSAAAAGMEAQRAALDVAARNVAAAEATAQGGSFERLVPRFAIAPASGADDGDMTLEGDADALFTSFETPAPVRFLGTEVQRGIDVDAVTEMVAVLNAQRAFEANASVFDLGKRLAERTIEVGRA